MRVKRSPVVISSSNLVALLITLIAMKIFPSSSSSSSMTSNNSPVSGSLTESSCKKDTDCREGKKCESTKWSGKDKICKLVPDQCKDNKDCDPCFECAEKILWGEKKTKVCVPR